MWAEVEEIRTDNDLPAYSHTTVLKREAVSFLEMQAEGVIVDCTLGGGGHTEAILETLPHCTVVGIDRDERSLATVQERLSRFGQRLRLVHGAFGDIEQLLLDNGISRVDGILADLGISSAQLADAERGMSFRSEGPLDMRMDRSQGQTALELISSLDQEELANVIYRFGEERRSRRVARCIKLALEDGRLLTTLDLRRAVVRAVGPARVGGVDPATRTFQALRIAVNGELDQLTSLLECAPRILNPNGLLVVISFHSLEERMVKRTFQNRTVWCPLTKKPMTAGEEELLNNPRSRSAKMRAARLLDNSEDDNSETDDSEDEELS